MTGSTWIDPIVFIAANLLNLLTAVMFIFRGRRKPGIGRKFGWAAVALGLPLAVAVVLNLQAARDWPFWVLPLVTVFYCLLELLLDGVLQMNFRRTRLLGPYLAAYYLGLMAMIGYAFLIGRLYGFITLVTYFINLAATYYSYTRVGHS